MARPGARPWLGVLGQRGFLLLWMGVQADSLSQITSTASIVLGGVSGGLLVAGLGSSAAFLLDAVSFIIIAVLIGFVQVAETRGGETAAGVEHELREGLRYLRESPLV